MALGARGVDVGWLVMRETLTIAVIGAVAGLPIAWWLSRFIESQLYGVTPMDGTSVGGSVLALAAAALVAGLAPTRRAVSVEPMPAAHRLRPLAHTNNGQRARASKCIRGLRGLRGCDLGQPRTRLAHPARDSPDERPLNSIRSLVWAVPRRAPQLRCGQVAPCARAATPAGNAVDSSRAPRLTSMNPRNPRPRILTSSVSKAHIWVAARPRSVRGCRRCGG